LKLNGKHLLLAYTNDVNILRESVHTVKENAEALVVATKEKAKTNHSSTAKCA